MSNDKQQQTIPTLGNSAPSVYQKQLMSVTPQNNGGTGWQNVGQSGLALAKSLGVLSEFTYKSALDKQKIEKEKAIKNANEVMSKASLEELKTMTTTQLLTKYGLLSFAENPWAIEACEKIKGTDLASRAKEGYALYKLQNNLAPAKTPKEEAQRYADYMHNQFSEITKEDGYTKAFQDSFFENFATDQITVANQKSAEQSNEIRGILVKSLNADISQVLSAAVQRDYVNSDPEGTCKQIQAIFQDTKYQSLGIDDIMGEADALCRGIVVRCKSPELLQKVASNLELFKDPLTGEKTLLKDVMDMSNYMPAALEGAAQTWDAHQDKLYEELRQSLKESPEAAQKLIESKPEKDRVYMNTVIDRAKAENEQEKREEQAALQQELSNQLTEESYNQAISTLEDLADKQLSAFMSGNTKDCYSNFVATKWGNVQEAFYFENGKKKKVDDDTLKEIYSNKARSKYAAIINEKSYNNTQKLDKTAKLMQWIGADNAKDIITTQCINCLDDINLSNFAKGHAIVPHELAAYYNMFLSNQARFKHVFGNEAAYEMHSLMTSPGSSLQQKCTSYAKYKDVSDDVKQKVATTAQKYPIKIGKHVNFMSTTGEKVRVSMALIQANPAIGADFREIFKRELIKNPAAPDGALDRTLYAIKNNYCVYKNDTLLPLGKFGSRDRQLTGLVADQICIRTKKRAGVFNYPVSIQWNGDSAVATCKGRTWIYNQASLLKIAQEQQYALKHKKG